MGGINGTIGGGMNGGGMCDGKLGGIGIAERVGGASANS